VGGSTVTVVYWFCVTECANITPPTRLLEYSKGQSHQDGSAEEADERPYETCCVYHALKFFVIHQSSSSKKLFSALIGCLLKTQRH